jgi:PASTA domain-containing protein
MMIHPPQPPAHGSRLGSGRRSADATGAAAAGLAAHAESEYAGRPLQLSPLPGYPDTMTWDPGSGQEGHQAWERLFEWYREGSSLPSLDGDAALLALTDIGLVRRLLDQIEFEAVRVARRQGKSWAEIAVRLGVTRQSAWERWRDVDDAAGLEPDEPESAHEPPSSYERRGMLRAVLRPGREIPLEPGPEAEGWGRRKRSSVRVPDVIGMTLDEARKVLGGKDLVAMAADPDGPSLGMANLPYTVVTDQSPESGARVPPGSPVRLWFDHGGGGGGGVREPRRPAPDPKTAQQMRDETTGEAVG